MCEWKERYQKIRTAIESEELEKADAYLKEQDAYFRTSSFSKQEIGEIIKEHQNVFNMLAERKQNIQDLLMAQSNTQKVAKKYGDD